MCFWSGILQATDYKPRCLQLNLVMTDTIGSTDCLYLNIWVPHGSSGKNRNAQKFILVLGNDEIF